MHSRSGDVRPPGDQPDGARDVFVPRVAAERGAERAQGVRVYGSEGLQRTRTLPGSLYPTSTLFGTLCPSEAEYEQYPDRHPFLWSRSPSIPTICRLYDPIREVFAAVVGRVLPNPNRCPAVANSPLFAFERPLPCQLDVPRDPAKLRGRLGEDSFVRHVKYDANLGRQRIPTIPPRPHTQVFFPDTGAPEDADLNRHEAPVTEENFECPSALGSRQVQHRLRVRPAVRVVNNILIPFLARPRSTPSWLFYLRASTA